MNLNELWSGTDYAYYEWKGRGELYRSNAIRVKVIRAFKEQIEGNNRLSGFADVLVCDRETGEIRDRPNRPGEQYRLKVRARDIAMRWEEYEEIHAQRVAQSRKAEEERRLRREAAEAERQRIEDLAKQKKDRIKWFLTDKYNLPENYITSITDYSITLSRAAIEQELEAPIG